MVNNRFYCMALFHSKTGQRDKRDIAFQVENCILHFLVEKWCHNTLGYLLISILLHGVISLQDTMSCDKKDIAFQVENCILHYLVGKWCLYTLGYLLILRGDILINIDVIGNQPYPAELGHLLSFANCRSRSAGFFLEEAS